MTSRSSTAHLVAASVLAVTALACAPGTEPRYLEDGITLPTASGVSDLHENPGEPAPRVASVYHMFARAGDHLWHCPMYDSGGICRDDQHWLTAIDGIVRSREQVVMELGAEADKFLEKDVDSASGLRLSALRVLIRADGRAPYGKINDLIEACATAKIYKTAFAAQFDGGEGLFECWIPADDGTADPTFVDVRVELRWSDVDSDVTRRFRERAVASDDELERIVAQFHDEVMRLHTHEPPLTLDATDRVPWRNVIKVIVIAKRSHFDKFLFARGEPETNR
jgi:biopolymer transport protein ExbD